LEAVFAFITPTLFVPFPLLLTGGGTTNSLGERIGEYVGDTDGDFFFACCCPGPGDASEGEANVFNDNICPFDTSLVVVGATTLETVAGAQCLLFNVDPLFMCLDSILGAGGGGGSACTPILLFSFTSVCTPIVLYTFFLALGLTTDPLLDLLCFDSASLSSSSSSSALSSSSPSRLLISVRSSQLFRRAFLLGFWSSNAGASAVGGGGGLTSFDAYFCMLGILSQAFE
jgi:hypothetical protein